MGEYNISEDNIPDVPRWVLSIVVGVRVIGGLLLTVAFLYVISMFTSVPLFPPVGESLLSESTLVWLGVVALIELVVVIVFFYPLMILSWLVATIFYKPLRDSLRTELDKEDDSETA